jgi:hypothetical protein
MKNSTGYLIVAYVGTTVLYGGYLLWLYRQERKLRRTSRDAAR